MALNSVVEKKLIWNQDTQQMEIKSEVVVQLVSNLGNVMAEEGPLFCSNGQEIFMAYQTLKDRLVKNLMENSL